MSYNDELQGRNAALEKILAKILALPSDAVRYGLAQELTAEQRAQVWANIGFTGLTLGFGNDGLLYIFADGAAVGNGIELPSGGIDGYITEGKQIVFNNLPDGEYTLAYVADDGEIVPIGAMEKDSTTYYAVTSKLTSCVSSNSAVQVAAGSSYEATITANAGYELESVVVTMGGSAVAVSGGSISIAEVTGDIVITAVAKAQAVVDPTNFFKATPTVSTTATASQDALVMGGRLGSDGGYRVDGGPDCLLSNYIAVQSGDVVYIKNADVYSNLNSGLYKSDKTTISVFAQAGSGDVTANSTTSGQNQYTVNNANAAYLRLCLKPAAAIKVNTSGADAAQRYDLTQVVVNVKRGGAWL